MLISYNFSHNACQMLQLFICNIWQGLWEKYELSFDTKISKFEKKKLKRSDQAP